MVPPKCCICLSYSTSEDGDYFVTTQSCGHLFHFSCIKEWLDRLTPPSPKLCPVCRSTVEVSSLVKLHGMSPVLVAGLEGNELKYNIKITLLGDSGTGKTSMLNSFTHGTYQGAVSATRGVDMGFKTLNFAGKKIKLTVWDCAGQDRFRAICPSYIRNSHGVIIVYDITDPTSFKNVDEWLNVAYESALPEVSILLAGNKCDLEDQRKISTEAGQIAARTSGFEFMETSAKDVINLDAAFRALLGKIVSTLWDEGYIDSFEIYPPTIKLSNEASTIEERPSRCSKC
ncbi:ras-related protein RIC1 isoform X1 [Folsomia candida]|uniref:ras-related protein RIC1 isoform X1 n=1 Tax=Folsomia candida TaxID=158441 RepID=UPI000B8F350C|nr:ras-related protein RIC1 isoform X1 [Folsomia candida]